jgi:hypothetical protein
MTPGLAAYKLSFQTSPIVLTGGIATNLAGGMLPIIALTQAAALPYGLFGGTSNVELDGFFANFIPLPGTTLIDNELGKYPFANQTVAANALISKPLQVSVLMICPVRDPAGYPLRTAIMSSLKASLDQHNQAAGTYIIATPSYFYTNCVLLSMRDVTSGDSKQVQTRWQLDFEQPLLTLQQASGAMNSLMTKMSNGAQINGQPAYTGVNPTVGLSSSLSTPALSPIASGVAGGTISNPIPGPQ